MARSRTSDKHIKPGLSESAPPFSFQGPDKKPVGYPSISARVSPAHSKAARVNLKLNWVVVTLKIE
jgi:hypothetical protein